MLPRPAITLLAIALVDELQERTTTKPANGCCTASAHAQGATICLLERRCGGHMKD